MIEFNDWSRVVVKAFCLSLSPLLGWTKGEGERSSVTARLSSNHRVSVCATLWALILFLHPVPLAQLPTLYISKMLTHPLCICVCVPTLYNYVHAHQAICTYVPPYVAPSSYPSSQPLSPWVWWFYSSSLVWFYWQTASLSKTFWPQNRHAGKRTVFVGAFSKDSVSLRNEGFPTFCLSLTTGRHLGFTKKLRNSRSRRLFANFFWGNTAMTFSLLSQFYVCGCE